MNIPKDIYILQGDKPGKTMTILGGVHGDEFAGIEVIKKLLHYFNVQEKSSGHIYYNEKIASGKLIVGFGNPDAIVQQTRGIDEDINLNRCFDPKKLKQQPTEQDSADLTRARELAPILDKTDILIDLHATSSPSKPFCITEKANVKKLKTVTKYLPVEYVVLDTNNVYTKHLGLTCTGATDAYVNMHGKKDAVGVCYETGYRMDTSIVENVFATMMAVLQETGIVQKKNKNITTYDQTVYTIQTCVTAKQDTFTYNGGMNQGWQEVTKGQVVGNYTDGTKECIPEDGMYIFPKGTDRIVKNRSLYFIAQKQE